MALTFYLPTGYTSVSVPVYPQTRLVPHEADTKERVCWGVRGFLDESGRAFERRRSRIAMVYRAPGAILDTLRSRVARR